MMSELSSGTPSARWLHYRFVRGYTIGSSVAVGLPSLVLVLFDLYGGGDVFMLMGYDLGIRIGIVRSPLVRSPWNARIL